MGNRIEYRGFTIQKVSTLEYNESGDIDGSFDYYEILYPMRDFPCLGTGLTMDRCKKLIDLIVKKAESNVSEYTEGDKLDQKIKRMEEREQNLKDM